MKGNTTIAMIVIVVLAAIVGFSIWNSNRAEDDAMMNDDNSTMEIEESMIEDEETNTEDTMMAGETTTIQLSAQGTEMPQSGTATLTDTSDGLMVVLNVDNGSEVAQPARIHQGACPEPGAVVYQLESLVDGESTTTIAGLSISQLMESLPLAINVHKSAEEVSVYTSCGDIQ